MISRALQVAVLCLLIAACDNPADSYPGQVTTTFDGGKELVVVAGYSLNTQSTGIQAWADVSVGTPGIIEMTGPMHMHCDGTFQAVPPQFNDPGNRPALDVGEGSQGAQFHSPAGSYTVTVAIASKKAEVKKSFKAGVSSLDWPAGVYDLPSGCVPVADTLQQLHDLTVAHVKAVGYWVSRMDASPLKSVLQPLADQANEAETGGDASTALDALRRIRAAVSPETGKTFEYRTYCEANESIALLTQPAPPS